MIRTGSKSISERCSEALLEGINHQGNPYEIPNSGRNYLPFLFKSLGYKVGVEVGVYKGYFTRRLAVAGLQIYGVDPWTPYEDFDRLHDNRKDNQDLLYKRAIQFLERYKNVTLLRKFSIDALSDFKNESIDFVYIDGNHRFQYVAEDICRWTKKVRKGGIISGHDYAYFKKEDNNDVKYVVDAYVAAKQIKNWYVLGREKAKEGELRDRFRSWFWVKK